VAFLFFWVFPGSLLVRGHMRTLALSVLLPFLFAGCAVVTVAGAVVTVVSTTVSVGATVVGTTVDVAAAGVKSVVGSDEGKN